MHVGCRIQVWTSTDRTSLVQEGKWNFQDCKKLGSLHINKKKTKQVPVFQPTPQISNSIILHVRLYISHDLIVL